MMQSQGGEAVHKRAAPTHKGLWGEQFMWTKSKSVKLTTALVWLCTAAAVAAVFFIPALVQWYVGTRIGYGAAAQTGLYLPLAVTLYVSLVPAFIALSRLMGLLNNIKLGQVFVRGNCDNLRALSYCCFAVCVIFTVFAFWRPIGLVIAFAAAFMGLILRVLKNAFEEAVSLREENDAVI